MRTNWTGGEFLRLIADRIACAVIQHDGEVGCIAVVIYLRHFPILSSTPQLSGRMLPSLIHTRSTAGGLAGGGISSRQNGESAIHISHKPTSM